MEKEAETNQSLLAECRSQRKKLAEEIKCLKRLVKELEVKIPKLSMEISRFDAVRADLTKFIPQLQSQCVVSEEDATLLLSLNNEVSKCQSDMSSCAALTANLETEVAQLQQSILDAGGIRFKKQQSACEKALANTKAAEKALTSAQVAVTTNEKAGQNAKKSIMSITKELEQSVRSIDEKKKELESLEKDALAVKQSYDQVKRVEEEKR
jgi:structural maintenance of chromosome 4